MSRRHKIPDARKWGASVVIKARNPDGSLDWHIRHARRLEVNLENRKVLENWCRSNRWTFEIKNNGHHWMFRKTGVLVEWWPSSAKLVRDKQWTNGVHIHDYLQVRNFLRQIERDKRKSS